MGSGDSGAMVAGIGKGEAGAWYENALRGIGKGVSTTPGGGAAKTNGAATGARSAGGAGAGAWAAGTSTQSPLRAGGDCDVVTAAGNLVSTKVTSCEILIL